MPSKKEIILIIEDEDSIREMVKSVLTSNGFEALEAESVAAAELLIADRIPRLILLDWMLPHVTGIEYVNRLKRNPITRDIPIILLTAKVDEENKIKGLGAGADDYIAKPFSPRELIARIKTVLRRGLLVSLEGKIHIQDLCLDIHKHQATINNKLVNLSPMEYRLLHYFMTYQNRVATRDQLLQHVWGGNTYVDERTVDVQVKRLRKVLAEHGMDTLIKTIRGVGYLLINKEE